MRLSTLPDHRCRRPGRLGPPASVLSVLATVMATVLVVVAAPAGAPAARAVDLSAFGLLDAGPVAGSALQVSPDGLWAVFSSASSSELRSVPVSGGRVRVLRATPWRDVVVAPDSSRVVITDDDTIWSESIAGGPQTMVVDQPGRHIDAVQVSPDSSWIVFRSDLGEADFRFNLYAVPIDGGAPVRLNGPLVAGGTVEFAVGSPDGRTVAYLADQRTDDVFELFTATLDAAGTATLRNAPLPTDGDVDNGFEFAPDGSWLAFTADALVDNRRDAYAVDLATGSTAWLSTDSGGQSVDFDFVFAPDSAAVYFSAGQRVLRADRLGGNRSAIYTGTAGTRIGTVLLTPDGGRVLAGILGGPVVSVPATGGAPVTLTANRASNRHLSVDGSMLVSLQDLGGSTSALRVARVDGSVPERTLLTGPSSGPGAIGGGSFSADGSTVYTNVGGEPVSLPVLGGPTTLLFPGPAFSTTSAWLTTPDGRRVVAIRDQYVDGTSALLALGPTTQFADWAKFVPLTPQRILDTRLDQQIGYSGPKPIAGDTVRLKVLGKAGVPESDEVRAVVVNVTATEASAAGFVTVWPSGGPRPLASSLNLEHPGQTRPNLVTVAVGAGGSIDLFTQTGTHLIADVLGYYTAAGLTTDGRFFPLAPSRILDTRSSGGVRPAAGETVRLAVAGRPGLPSTGMSAVVLNVTATEAAGDGFVTVWPSGRARPLASNLNLEAAGQTIANQVIVPLGADGTVSIFTQRGTHLVVDVAGWFSDGTEATGNSGLFRAFAPIRMLDTRPESRQHWSGATPAAGAVVPLTFGVPGDGTLALTVNVTATESTLPGFLTVWPAGLVRPLASNLNLAAAGQTIANHVTVRAGAPRGDVSIFTSNGTHVVADVTGLYTG